MTLPPCELVFTTQTDAGGGLREDRLGSARVASVARQTPEDGVVRSGGQGVVRRGGQRQDSWVANQRLVLAVVPVAALVEAAVAAEMGTAMDIGLVRKAMARVH